MNIKHSSETAEWYTPITIIETARKVLGSIDLDPASNAEANARVMAFEFYTKEQNGLKLPWDGSVFCNPPGGRVGNKSLTSLFWDKLMHEPIDHAIFICFSIEAMQTTQKSIMSVGEFPFCVPRKRIAFDRPDGTRGSSPSHCNLIVYVPNTKDESAAFWNVFSELGMVRI